MILKICVFIALAGFAIASEHDLEQTDYEVKVLAMGSSDSDNLNDWGVITNNFNDDFTSELMDNNHPSLIYVIDSSMLKEASMAKQIHFSVMLPTFKEVKGLGRYYVFDCQHPKALEHKEEQDDFFRSYLGACSDSNENKSPSF